MFQRFTMIVNNMRANVTVLPYDDHDRVVKLLHSLDCTVWGAKVEAILESGNYETLTMDELFSKLKSSKVDHGVRGKIESPTDPHSLALVSGPRTNANLSSREFSMSTLVSLIDEEFDVLGEEDLTLPSRRFEHMYTNQKNARRNSGMCYQCGKHRHFIAKCLEAMRLRSRTSRLRTRHKHRSRKTTRARTNTKRDYKGKNKSEWRLRKSGSHQKKTEHAMVAGVSDIDSSSCYTSSSSSDEEEEVDRHKSKRSSKNINDQCFTT
jgi:hypothetical protein